MKHASTCGTIGLVLAITAMASCRAQAPEAAPCPPSTTAPAALLPPPGALPSPALLWKRTIEAGDQPQVAGTSVLGREGEMVVALDVQTGAERWRAKAGDGPFVVGDRALLFDPTADGKGATLSALDSLTGRVLWAVPSTCGGLRIPTDCGAHIVMVCSHRSGEVLAGVDSGSGAARWEAPAPNNTAALACGGDTLHVAQWGPGSGLVEYDLTTGVDRGGNYLTGHVSTPVRSRERLLLLDELAVWGYRPHEQQIVWLYARDRPVFPWEMNYAVRDGHLLLPGPHAIHGINGETGKVTRSWPLPKPAAAFRLSELLPFIAATPSRLLATWLAEEASDPSYLLIWEGEAATPLALSGPPNLARSAVVGDVVVERFESGVRAFSLLRTDPPRTYPAE